MKRRLDLASALVHAPDVLFLDEAAMGHDVVSVTLDETEAAALPSALDGLPGLERMVPSSDALALYVENGASQRSESMETLARSNPISYVIVGLRSLIIDGWELGSLAACAGVIAGLGLILTGVSLRVIATYDR